MAEWWQERPIRLIQTNLREIDTRRDPREIVREVSAFGANTILFSVGGIVSFYPTQLRFQTPIPYLKGDTALARTPIYRSASDRSDTVRDFVGEALEEAHSLGLRFIARLDLSKCHKHVYESRPEWFFRRADGQPQVYNGLYSTCVNGGYYQAYSLEIMREVLDRYAVDGFFFNMFGYKSTDYSGNYHGLCQCESCARRFQEMYGKPLPRAEDVDDPRYLDYVAFRRTTADELTGRIADFIHQQEGLALVNYQVQFADIVRSEANSKVDRPLPMWQFSASDNVKRVRGTYPTKPSCSAAVYFVDIPYRFASVSPDQTALRLAQDLAHGGDLDLYVLGTLEQEDGQAIEPARRVYQFAARHQDTYRGLRSLAETCLLYPQASYACGKSTQEAYRGAFRLLTENHVLFDSAHDFALDNKDAKQFLDRYELLVLPGVACLSDRQCAAIDDFLCRGGRVLATGETALYDQLGRPRDGYGLLGLGVERVKTAREDMRSAYFRVHDHDRMSQLPDTDLLFLDGSCLFASTRPGASTSLTLVPPCTFGPPEKVAIDQVESDMPGLVWYTHGEGQSAYLPWEVDALYYRHSSPGHRGAFMSALHALCPQRQVITDANPQIELALLSQKGGLFVFTLVNASGHHGTAFFAPMPAFDVEVKLRLPYEVRSAMSLQLGKRLTLWQEDEYACFALDRLDLFDTVRLD
jgi:hypothetical protein